MTIDLRNCAHCGVCFESAHPTAMYCAESCRTAAALRRRNLLRDAARVAAAANPRPVRFVACGCGCGTQFAPVNNVHRYAGPECKDRVNNARRPERARSPRRRVTPPKPAARVLTPAERVSWIQPSGRAADGRSLQFTCKHCGAQYDDSNRLGHHVRVTHDDPYQSPHEVAPIRTARSVRIA